MHLIDASRLLCPMPVIKLQNAVAQLNNNSTVQITCTDPGVLHDIPAWATINGHKIVRTEHQADKILLTVLVCKA